MKNPQDLAKELNQMFPNKDLKVIGDNACCAFVLLWCLGIEPDDIEAIKIVQRMRDREVLRKDCSVLWYKAVRYLTGRDLKSISFEKIKTIMQIKERTPVLYAKAGNKEGVGHWVGVQNGKIAFNPKFYSVNVNEGRPVEMRVLKL